MQAEKLRMMIAIVLAVVAGSPVGALPGALEKLNVACH